MDQKAVVKLCKELGCCDACCLRFIGLKNPNAYEDPHKSIAKYQDETEQKIPQDYKNKEEDENTTEYKCDGGNNSTSSPPTKKQKKNNCLSCLGILQEDSWPLCFEMVKEMLDKKQYDCNTFACALSAPMVILLREKIVLMRLSEAIPEYDAKCVTALKEAWKWSCGIRLASHVGLEQHSGAQASLLVTVHMECPDELQELEILKKISPALFEERNRNKKRFAVEFTRRGVEAALAGVELGALKGAEENARGGAAAICVSVGGNRAPIYLGGRYIKLSRDLPQTPWLVNGRRMMHSSVQETIFAPIADIYQLFPEECEHRLKFMSAGREDVDVRCLGDGRPFAVEITDPRRELTSAELQRVCEEISSGGKVVVKSIVPVTKEQLMQLKLGEETKCKTYEALCVKLQDATHSNGTGLAINSVEPAVVTPEDIDKINSYRNTPDGDDARICIQQKTPIRVLHRRPLLTRMRRIYELEARMVPDRPYLFAVRLRCEAGTYVKEWAHGELSRSQPSLSHALISGRADILALDVKSVHLPWPPTVTA